MMAWSMLELERASQDIKVYVELFIICIRNIGKFSAKSFSTWIKER